MGASHTQRGRHPKSRTAGGCGFAFLFLLLVGASMASVPGGHDSTAAVRAYYEEHAAVVAVAQLVELAATVPLVVFVMGLSRSRWVDYDARKGLLVAGCGVAVAAILTTVPPLWLCVVGPTGPSTLVRNLAVFSDGVDVLLFLTIAGFATACWRVWRGPSWVGAVDSHAQRVPAATASSA